MMKSVIITLDKAILLSVDKQICRCINIVPFLFQIFQKLIMLFFCPRLLLDSSLQSYCALQRTIHLRRRLCKISGRRAIEFFLTFRVVLPAEKCLRCAIKARYKGKKQMFHIFLARSFQKWVFNEHR